MISEESKKIDLGYYAKYVKYLADNKENVLFLNSGNDHARIVLSQIFKSSEKNIRILAGNLLKFKDDDSYINALINFVEKEGTKLQILLNDFKNQKEEKFRTSKLFPILWYYINQEKKEIILRATSKHFYTHGEEVHFTTGDERMFRIETNLTERKARCNFNNTEIVKDINILFDEEFDQADNINLTMLLYGNNK